MQAAQEWLRERGFVLVVDPTSFPATSAEVKLNENTKAVLGPAYQVRLGTIPDGHFLVGVCLMCRHMGVIDHKRLIERHTGHGWVVDRLPKFRCQACRARGEGLMSFGVHRVMR